MIIGHLKLNRTLFDFILKFCRIFLQLLFQFLTESVIINITAIIIALTIIQLSASPFNRIVGKGIINYELIDVKFAGMVIMILICCIVVSGFYPSLILSAMKPVVNLNVSMGRSARIYTTPKLAEQ